MTKRSFNISIHGRVKKIKTNDFLVPLYEAISNSIHAIEQASVPGMIDVTIVRGGRQIELGHSGADAGDCITGFVVHDDGAGFGEANMTSFCEADSTFKASIGGKGVGRFSWLKFFERVAVQSVFDDDGKRYRRAFVFSLTGVDDEEVNEVDAARETCVRLYPLHVVHESRTKLSLQDVAIAVVEHFIAYLVTRAMPSLKIRDGSAGIDVADLYNSSIGKNAVKRDFTLGGHVFRATGVRNYLGNGTHTGFLCGDKRVAERVMLGKRDPFFTRRFHDEFLRPYAFQMFVESDYLDAIVHDDRDGFRFPEPLSLDATLESAVTKDQVAEELLRIASEELAEEVDKLKASNVETVTNFVMDHAPQYRRLVVKHRDAIAEIHDSEPAKIDLALRRIQFQDENKTRAELRVLLIQADEDDEKESKTGWAERSRAVLEQLSEEGKANLAAYIVHRKHILELLQKKLEVADDQYAREEAIHSLIFPMRTTSDDVSYEDQNLWMIDERLSYHYYLASDKPLRAAKASRRDSSTGVDSGKEPDIIVFNRPIALNDQPEGERVESIVILEFKRPGESSVEGQKHPVSQILEYIEIIQEGRAKDRKGRPIQAPHAYFFGYVICELDPHLKKVLKRSTMKETPDGRGMFGFFEEHRAYIEVISFEKMVDDARKRNRILFEKLQLPIH